MELNCASDLTPRLKGGGPTPNGKNILNFHFDYLNPSLKFIVHGASLEQSEDECKLQIDKM